MVFVRDVWLDSPYNDEPEELLDFESDYEPDELPEENYDEVRWDI